MAVNDTQALNAVRVLQTFKRNLVRGRGAAGVFGLLLNRDISTLVGFEGVERTCGPKFYPADAMWFGG